MKHTDGLACSGRKAGGNRYFAKPALKAGAIAEEDDKAGNGKPTKDIMAHAHGGNRYIY